MKIVRTVFLSLMLLVLSSGLFGIVVAQQGSQNPQSEEPYSLSIGTEKVVANLGTSLDNWCGVTFEFLPDGAMICGELRSGRVRMIENNTLQPVELLKLDVYAGWKNEAQTIFDEEGLVGLALDPNFNENHYVYLHWTYCTAVDQTCPAVIESGSGQTARQVARFTLVDDKLVDKKVLLDGIPGAKQHVGGPLEFGSDGKLYVTGGEAGMKKEAQNLESGLGKILRINPDGTIPDDNPFPGKPYYTIGHRNVFGIGFHPLTGVPYITENGPETNDEINVLYAGKNYGWPDVLGATDDPKYVSPLFDTGPGTIAPTELAFYTGDKYPPELVNDLFYLAYNLRSLERLELEAPGYDKVVAQYSYQLPPTGIGSYTDIELGPDGYFYVSDFKTISRVLFEFTNVTTSFQIDQPSPSSTGTLTPITAKIVDYFDKPVVNVPVNFFASGEPIGSATTNQDGVARLVFTPTFAGEFSITAAFDGNPQFRASISKHGVTLVVQGTSTQPPQVLEAMAENGLIVRLSVIPSGEQNDNSSLKFGVKFIDPRTETELEEIPYLVEIVRDDAVLFSKSTVSSRTQALHEYDFEETGPAEIIVKDINNTPSSVRFSINIVPEFPLHAAMIPPIGLVMAFLALRYRKFRLGSSGA